MARNGNDTTRTDATPTRQQHKKGEWQKGVREADGVKEGVWKTRRDRERVGKGEYTKQENIKRQIVSTIIKRKSLSKYGKMQNP